MGKRARLQGLTLSLDYQLHKDKNLYLELAWCLVGAQKNVLNE